MSLSPETEATTAPDPLDAMAEEFAGRCRRGERPSVEEYAARLPERAEEVRRLLATVALLERGKARSCRRRGSGSGRSPRSPRCSIAQLGENSGSSRELGARRDGDRL